MTAISQETVTILSGASLSNALNLDSRNMFGILMPTGWDAAAITFRGSYDGTNFYDLYDDTGTEINFVVAASRYVLVSFPAKFFGLKKLIVRSGTTGAAVNQTANRAIGLILIPDA